MLLEIRRSTEVPDNHAREANDAQENAKHSAANNFTTKHNPPVAQSHFTNRQSAHN